MAGITDAGFTKPTLGEIKIEIESALLAQFGAYINLLPSGFFGQLAGVMAERFDDLWQAELDIYTGRDPDAAAGALLAYLAKLSGVTKLVATKSTVTLTVNLDATTTLLAGRLVSNATTGVQFTTTAAVTSTTAGDYSVASEATVTGPVAATASSLTTIDTPQAGWNTVTNALDAASGIDVETDAALRTRRTSSLQVSGSTTVGAIKSDIAALTGVTEVFVLENDTDATDANGLPPHSFEAVVENGTTLTIAQKIWDDGRSAGIRTYGSVSQAVVDAEGNTKTVYFSRPTDVPVFVDVTAVTDTNYPVDGDTQVAAAIAAADASFGISDILYASTLYDEVFSVAGVVSIVTLLIGLTSSPASASLTPAAREKFSIDSGDVTVTS